MTDRSRRTLLKAATTTLIPIAATGCVSTDQSQSKTTSPQTPQTNSSSTTLSNSTTADYGPWAITVDNNLNEDSTVTLQIITPDGAVHKQRQVTVEGGDGSSVLTVTESGPYTLKASTEFDGDSIEFKACKLNSDGIVELYTTDGENNLTVSQRHIDPGANTTTEDPYSCD